MKKKLFMRVVICLMVIFLLFSLVGCNQSAAKQNSNSTDNKEATPSQKVERISIIAGSSSGVWYLVAGGMAKVINKYVPGVEATVEPGGGAENIIRVANKEATFGLSMSDNLAYALKGTREFNKAYPEIQAVLSGHDSPMKLITRADSKISSISDLKGKKVGLGYPGSAQAITTAAIMEALELIPDKDFKPMWLTPAEICDALLDKSVDAGFVYLGDPVGSIIDLSTKIDIKFVPYDVEKIVALHPYWYKTISKGGTYKGIDEDYECQGGNVVMVTHKDTDPELVYQVTKAILEHIDEVAEVHPAGKEWNIDNILRGITSSFHTGTERYLKEKGVIK